MAEDNRNLWELKDKELNIKLDKLSLDELAAEKEKLYKTEVLDKKQKKARDKVLRDIDKRMDLKKLQGDIFTEPPRSIPVKPDVKTKTNTTSSTSTSKTGNEKKLDVIVEKSNEAADEFNAEELSNKKAEDAKTAAENAKNRGLFIDDSLEHNSPNWFWKEAREISPTDKAKRGFLITNHVFNTLGTGLGNIGATVQNNGGSGGGVIKNYNSYIDQYRQSKLDQLMSNRKAKQDSILQQQIRALEGIGASENEALQIQNRLRNSKFRQKYERLNNEEQLLIQALLYKDTKGSISDATLGKMVDRLIEGDDISAEQAITTVITSEVVENKDKLLKDIKSLGDTVAGWLGYNKPSKD